MKVFNVKPGDTLTINHSIVIHVASGTLKVLGPKETHCLLTAKKETAKLHSKGQSCAKDSRHTSIRNKNRIKLVQDRE